MQEENKLLLSESLMSSLNSSLAAPGSSRSGEPRLLQQPGRSLGCLVTIERCETVSHCPECSAGAGAAQLHRLPEMPVRRCWLMCPANERPCFLCRGGWQAAGAKAAPRRL